MYTSEIMDAYNKHERINACIPGYQKITLPEVIKFISDDSTNGFINYYQITADKVDAIIERELDYFSKLSCSFEWKTYDTDQPSSMGENLLVHGFAKGEVESFMVLDLASAQSDVNTGIDVIEVNDLQGISDVIAVQEQVWQEDFSTRFEYLANCKKLSPDECSIYVIYAGKKPVTSAWITYNGDSPFAGMWGGSTLSEYRGRGYYSALLHRRIADAKQRGKKYLTIDASEMSRPIVEKFGFKLIAKTTPYMYEFG